MTSGSEGAASYDASILIIVENLPLPFDRRVWMESLTLAANGYRVVAMSPSTGRYPAADEMISGVRVLRYSLPDERSSALGYLAEYWAALRGQIRIIRQLAREGYEFDVVHVCNPPDLGFIPALLAKMLWGARYVFDHHDLSPELYESKFGRRGPFYWALRVVERMNFLVADVSIATNESYREVALERGRMSPESVYVVRSGPALEHFTVPDKYVEYRNGHRHLVGYVGVMGEFDGVDHLVEAAKHLIKDRGRDDVRFCLIGDGPARADLQQWTRDEGLSEWVEFTGRIPDEELRQRIVSCDLCVDPDPPGPLNSVSTMNKVLEYMALGKPVAMYRLREGEASAGEAGEYAEGFTPSALADAIERLLDDESLRARRGRVGRGRIESSLSWEHQAPLLLEAYDHARRMGSG